MIKWRASFSSPLNKNTLLLITHVWVLNLDRSMIWSFKAVLLITFLMALVKSLHWLKMSRSTLIALNLSNLWGLLTSTDQISTASFSGKEFSPMFLLSKDSWSKLWRARRCKEEGVEVVIKKDPRKEASRKHRFSLSKNLWKKKEQSLSNL